jgi:hypothetical protein
MTSEKTLDWMEGLARNLILHAARHAPGPLSERLTEEWLADMSERPSGFSRLRFALGCCWATSVIAREHGAALPVRSGALAPASLGGHAQLVPAFFRDAPPPFYWLLPCMRQSSAASCSA